MASLKDKIENVLNETRILVLGIQIFIGFSFRGFFEPGFVKMLRSSQIVELYSLGLMLVGLGFLMIPAPYHRIVLHGRNTGALHRLATATVTIGLLPFALSMGLSLFLGSRWVVSDVMALSFSAIALVLVLTAWYGWPLLVRSRRRRGSQLRALLDPLQEVNMNEEEQTDLSTRVKQVLIECRVVLPGAQALLGFQLIIMWMSAFEKIPRWWKFLHLASLSSIAICTVLLILPAAYHRIVEQGEDSEMLHHITSRALLSAMVFLAVGVCSDFYLVARVTEIGNGTSVLLSAGLLLFFLACWFGFPYWKKLRLHEPELTRSHLERHHGAA